MISNTLYHLTVEGTDIVVRFNSELINRDRIMKMLDALERELIRQQCSRKEEGLPILAQHPDHTY